jgi:hypothetical protein
LFLHGKPPGISNFSIKVDLGKTECLCVASLADTTQGIELGMVDVQLESGSDWDSMPELQPQPDSLRAETNTGRELRKNLLRTYDISHHNYVRNYILNLLTISYTINSIYHCGSYFK